MSTTLAEPLAETAANEQRQVRAALNPALMGEQLRAALGAGSADCRILDVKYEPSEYCTTLYQLGERMVIGTLRWDARADELPPSARLIAPLGMAVYRFEHDPALPGLARVLDPQQLVEVLSEALPECRDGARVLRGRATPLRYRPGKRCTLRVDLWLRDAGASTPRRRTLFAKVYHDGAKAASVYGEMQMLADSAPARDGRVVVASPTAFLPELKLILQAPIRGTSLELLLEGMHGAVTGGDKRGFDGVVRSASAFAALHTAGLETDRQRPIESELKRFAKRAAQAAAIAPAIGERLGELAAKLPEWLPALPGWGAEIGLVHGDCKHSQCMVTPDGIAILDWDHCGMADPATDIGTYVATLRQMGIWQALRAREAGPAAARARWLRALEDDFLDAYCAASGFGPGFRQRVIWYEAAALMRKALRGFARSPRSPMPLAQVEEAWRCLATLDAAA